MSASTASTSTSLALYDRINDPIAGMQALGKAIAKAQMFGCSNEEQGQVFAMECMVRKIPPLSLAAKYHIIFGKLSQKADDMLSDFLKAGGRSKILERSPAGVSVELTFDGNTQVFSLTWEEALKEPFVYDGKEKEILAALAANKKPVLKPKYSTPRSRMQMLWARVISDAIRCMAPGVNNGVYTPEEVQDAGELAGEIVDGEFQVVKDEEPPRKTAAELMAEQLEAKANESKAKKPEATVATAATTLEGSTDPEQLARCTSAQVQRILELYSACEVTKEEMDKVLAKYKVGALKSLSLVDAGTLIGNLEKRLEKMGRVVGWQQEKEEAAPEPTVAEPSKESALEPGSTPKPCTTEQRAKIVELLTIANQIDPRTTEFFQKMLRTSGRQKITDLDTDQAEELIDLIPKNKWQSFFTPNDDIPF